MIFGISGPGARSPIENTAFSAYAYHQQRIEDFINLLAASDDPNDFETQIDAAIDSGVDYNRLTSDELEYIEKEVVKRR
jgi:hypothetical protein